VFVAATSALDAQEPVLEQPALQVVFEFPADELGKLAARTFDVLHEKRAIFSNNGIERGLFRSMPVVGRRDGDRRQSRRALIGSLRTLLALRANRTHRQPALDMNGWSNPVMVRPAVSAVCGKSS
jgi:hypothetical protein